MKTHCMILTIDIGNTTISLGLMKGTRVVKRVTLETHANARILSKQLTAVLRKLRSAKISRAAICSVVPSKTKSVEECILRVLGLPTVVIGRDIAVPLTNRYRNPKQVGQDRLVGAYAALKLYGAPAIVIDFGTAITFDVVSAKKEYLGGIIVPGLRLSAESLFNKTALLPRVKIQCPRSLIGRDTQGSILSGLFYGYGALSSGLIDRIAKTIKGNPKVIITGGHLKLVKRFISRQVNVIDPDLVFHGITLLLAL